MRKNILHIISGDLWGGAETQVLHQIEALKCSKQFHFSAMMFSDKKAAHRFRKSGIPLHITDEQHGFFTLIKSAVQIVRKDNIKLIVAHGYKEAMVAIICRVCSGIPLIVTYHGRTEAYKGFSGLKMSFYLALQKLIAKYLAARVITCSRTLASELNLNKLGKLRIVYNVVPCSVTSPPRQDSSNLKLEHPAIICVGRLAAVKQVDQAIYLTEKFNQRFSRKVHTYIVGNGPLEEKLKSLVKERKLSHAVSFLGFRNDAADLIAMADALLISSKSEGLPTILLEALSAGTPILSTSLPGIKEVMEFFPDYPFATYTDGDLSSGVEALSNLLHTSKEIPQQGIKASLKQHFSPQTAANKHSIIYKEVLA